MTQKSKAVSGQLFRIERAGGKVEWRRHCLCLESDHEPFVSLESAKGPGAMALTDLLCPVCRMRHTTIPAKKALEESLISEGEYRFLYGPPIIEPGD
jgi:hypothetical protein